MRTFGRISVIINVGTGSDAEGELSITSRRWWGVWIGNVGSSMLIAMLAVLSVWISSCGMFNPPLQKQLVQHPHVKAQPYVIGRDDELEVIVWTQPQLSGKVNVATDGTITMPLIGRVQAAGMTPDQLKDDLRTRYTRYVHEPNVTVRVSDAASQIFYVVGEVNKPGAFRLHSGEVLSQAMAESGGLGQYADGSNIRILRHDDANTEVLTVNYDLVRSGKDVSADVPIQPGDTITVP
jgi:polysaccharide export outer membrane protein